VNHRDTTNNGASGADLYSVNLAGLLSGRPHEPGDPRPRLLSLPEAGTTAMLPPFLVATPLTMAARSCT
jgi:hypothetical protein